MSIAQTSTDLIGLSLAAHLLIAAVTIVALGFVLHLVRQRRLEGKYALLWLAAMLPLLALAVFPGLLSWASEKVGVFYPPALFLLAAVAFLFIVVVHFSYELTKLESRTRILAEEVALLKAERQEIL